jgi:uncharacterized membrane protein YfcA
MTKRHPKADRPLINYSIAFLMAPSTILGTVFGIMLYQIFPQWFVLILLIGVLGLTNYRTYAKAIEMHKKEKKEAASLIPSSVPVNVDPIQGEHDNHDEDERTSLMRGYGTGSGASVDPHGTGSDSGEEQMLHAKEVASILYREAHTPVYKIAGLVFLWLTMLLLVLVRGGGEQGKGTLDYGIKLCSWQFALMTVAIILILGGGSAIGVLMQLRRTRQLRQAGIAKVEGDVEWTVPKFVGFVAVGCFAGTCAGFLGIGSGMINVPYMLEIGMQPEVAAATSSFIIVFTALSTVVQYFIIGAVPIKSGAWYGSIGLISAIVGQFAISAIVKKYKKSSIISFMLGGLISASAVGLIAMAIYKMVIHRHDKVYWQFHSYCHPAGEAPTTNKFLLPSYTPTLRWNADPWEP